MSDQAEGELRTSVRCRVTNASAQPMAAGNPSGRRSTSEAAVAAKGSAVGRHPLQADTAPKTNAQQYLSALPLARKSAAAPNMPSKAVSRAPRQADAAQSFQPSLLSRNVAAHTAAQSRNDAKDASAVHSRRSSSHPDANATWAAAEAGGQLATVMESAEEAEVHEAPQQLLDVSRLAELAAVDSTEFEQRQPNMAPSSELDTARQANQSSVAPVATHLDDHAIHDHHQPGQPEQAVPPLQQSPERESKPRQDLSLASTRQRHGAQQSNPAAAPDMNMYHASAQSQHSAAQQRRSPVRESVAVSRQPTAAAYTMPVAAHHAAAANPNAAAGLQVSGEALQQLQASLAQSIGSSVEAAMTQMR